MKRDCADAGVRSILQNVLCLRKQSWNQVSGEQDAKNKVKFLNLSIPRYSLKVNLLVTCKYEVRLSQKVMHVFPRCPYDEFSCLLLVQCRGDFVDTSEFYLPQICCQHLHVKKQQPILPVSLLVPNIIMSKKSFGFLLGFMLPP